MNGLKYSRIMSQLIDRPLFMHPRSAMIFYNALAGRMGIASASLPDDEIADMDQRLQARSPESKGVKASRFEGSMVRPEDGHWMGVEPFKRTSDGIAIISSIGELVNRGSWVGASSGVVSYEGTAFQFKRAAIDPRTKAIVWDASSPGGDCVGCPELAALVKKVSGEKPVYTVANGMMASAAYMIGSQGTRVFNTDSGVVGSIGCVMLHVDMSKALDKAGLSPTFIYAGAQKIDGNPAEALSPDVKDRMQTEVDTFYQKFCNIVGSGRGRALSAKAARATEAACFIGEEAQKIGLVDGVGSFDDILSEATTKVKRQSSRSSSSTRSRATMTKSGLGILGDDDEGENGDVAAQREKDRRKAQRNEAIRAEATAAATKAANDRIAAIIGHKDIKGSHVEAAIFLALEEPTMSAESVIKTVARLAPPKGPEGQREAGSEIEDGVAKSGVNGLTTGALPETDRRDGGSSQRGAGTGAGAGHGGSQADNGWGKAVEKVNSQNARRTGGRR